MHKNLNDTPKHVDDRGVIQMIFENCSIGSISRISTNPGNWRARHTHPNDNHYCEVLSGEMECYERKTGTNDKPTKEICKAGDVIFTPSGVDHEMVFNVFTIFNCYSKLPRTAENYEKETIRFPESLKEIYDNWKD